VAGDAGAQSFATSDNALHVHLISDSHNGVFTARGDLATAIAQNDPGGLIAALDSMPGNNLLR